MTDAAKPDELADVIELFPGRDMTDEQRMLHTERPVVRCLHHRYRLEPVERRTFCLDCGVAIDTFEVLDELAREPERYMTERREAQRRARLAVVELGDIERAVRNAKARLRTQVRKFPACVCGEKVFGRGSGPWCSQCGGRR